MGTAACEIQSCVLTPQWYSGLRSARTRMRDWYSSFAAIGCEERQCFVLYVSAAASIESGFSTFFSRCACRSMSFLLQRYEMSPQSPSALRSHVVPESFSGFPIEFIQCFTASSAGQTPHRPLVQAVPNHTREDVIKWPDRALCKNFCPACRPHVRIFPESADARAMANVEAISDVWVQKVEGAHRTIKSLSGEEYNP
ncbi:hypothetical protein B0T17DRAFT_502253 [Bombardia bombarda]|uniref:Uncharacterized protein n=1 Tax=Bombardia bombarda TaxID=252184 RepID=A0AA39XIG8_9PEZI|nr:hypothetical protein B0T17DRAFT_502253 [Bombardia bombarda]